MSFHNELYRIGCPVWNCIPWKGTVYSAKAPKTKWLAQYSVAFNTVEGNSTFYGIPHLDTFRKWGDQTTDGFSFCLKFPRAISHDCELVNAERETEEFLKGVEVLSTAQRLGPSFLQLGPNFGPEKLSQLANYIGRLPTHFSYAVEVRNHGWFEEPHESALNQLLSEHKMDRVIFDSRPLNSAPASDESELQSQRRKPKTPIRTMVTGKQPMLRLVGRNDLSTMKVWIDAWVPIIADWIGKGLNPIVFAHTADDHNAPEFARLFHNSLAKIIDNLNRMEDWPMASSIQRELF